MHRDHPATDYRSVITGDTQLVDVREPHEVADGTLPGSVNIPLGQLPERIHSLDAKRRVALLCRSGGRSARAAQLLVASGFADVVNLAGGMLAIAAASR